MPCGDYSAAAKPKYAEILDFKHFVKHTVFNSEGDKFRNKEVKNYVVVKAVIDMVCGNTIKPKINGCEKRFSLSLTDALCFSPKNSEKFTCLRFKM